MFKDKQEVRDWVRQQRRFREPSLISEKSKRIRDFCTHLLIQFNPSRCFLFAPTPYEVDLLSLVSSDFADIEFALPVVSNKVSCQMYFATWDGSSLLIEENYGIRIPARPHTQLLAKDGDLVFIPSLALDPFGGRVGHGMGFYDRWLSEQPKSLRKIGVGFVDCLALDPLPLESYDQRMDIVVNESAIYWT